MTTTVDTFTGNNGDGPPSPWVVATLSGSQSIQSNKWHIANGASNAGTAMTRGATTYADVDITVSVTLDAGGGVQFPAIAMRIQAGGTNGWGAFTEPAGYEVYIDTTTATLHLAIAQLASLVDDTHVVPMTLTAGHTIKLRGRCFGSVISCKAWDTTGSEPDQWMLSFTDTTYTTGMVGFRDAASVNTTVSDWDDFILNDAPPPGALAPTFVQTIGTQVSNSAATTTVISFTGATKPAVGDLVVVFGSRDDAASEASTPTGDTSFTDSHSNTYSKVVAGSGHTDATAANGQVGVMFYSLITTAWAGTETLTWTHPSTKAAMRMEHWTGVSGVRGSNTATSTAGAPSCALAGVVHGDLVLGMAALEYSTAGTVTGDTDSTGGTTWASIVGVTATTGTTLAASKVFSQWKVPTSDGTQTYNPTHSVTTNVDAIAIVAAFIPFLSQPSVSFRRRGIPAALLTR